MIDYLFPNIQFGTIAFIGIMFAFLATCLILAKCMKFLPRDMGREFAHNGALSAGKPRGAGFVFIIVFTAATLLFGKINYEILIYLVLVIAAMMTGFLDDCAKAPWGEYKKGLLDLIIAVMLAVTYLNFNDNEVYLVSFDKVFTINPVVYGIFIVILVWASINVTNCTDGVDGLSGTLTIITLSTIYVMDLLLGSDAKFAYTILVFIVSILGYLWFNATPSKMLMGDAGSRAMGLFISIAILKTGSPFMYLLVAAVIIVDGGLGLIKVSLLRFLKIRILTNVRTPIHDHVRKVWDWSNTQTVYRFSIIQIVLSIAAVYLLIARHIL